MLIFNTHPGSLHSQEEAFAAISMCSGGRGWEEKGGMQQQRSSPWLTALIRARAAALPSLSADPAPALGLPIPTPRQREGLHCSLDINLNYSGAPGNRLPPLPRLHGDYRRGWEIEMSSADTPILLPFCCRATPPPKRRHSYFTES